MSSAKLGRLRASHLPCGRRLPGRWSSIARGCDGLLHCAPLDALSLLAIDPISLQVSHVPLPSGLRERGTLYNEQDTSWTGVAAGSDGKLYFSVGEWTPQTTHGGTVGLDGSEYWQPDGSLRLLPWTPHNHQPRFCIMVFDPATQVFSYKKGTHLGPDTGISHEGSLYLFSGIAAAPNGKLYCSPQNASCVLVIDTADEQLAHIPVEVRRSDNWSGIALAKNGKLYCSPMQSWKVLEIDPLTDTVAYIKGCQAMAASWSLGDHVENFNKWGGIAAAANGKLYCCPWDARTVLVIDPEERHLSFIPGAGEGANKWAGIVAAQDGLLYCAPWNSATVLVIDPVAESLTHVDVFGLGDIRDYAPRNEGWCGIIAEAKRLWCAPCGASTVLTLPEASPHFTSLWNPVKFPDMAIAADDGRRIECHRAVLAAASLVFERMLSGDFAEKQTATIAIRRATPSTVAALVQYIYTGEVPEGTDLVELIGLADMYGLHTLVTQCADGLLSGLTEIKVRDVARALQIQKCATIEAAWAWARFLDIVRRDDRLFASAMEELARRER